MHNRILLVDDEEALRTLITGYFQSGPYAFAEAASCGEALRMFRQQSFDLVILDVMLPDGDGFMLFSRIRELAPKLPILFLSARDEDEARLHGLGLGADDYMTKPFLLKELELRIGAVLKRVYGEGTNAEAERYLTLDRTVVDFGSAVITRGDGTRIQLTAKEFTLLRKLTDNRGKIVTTDSLCEALWDGELIGYENALMVHIRRLREKLEEDPSTPRHLLTVRGLGYKLI